MPEPAAHGGRKIGDEDVGLGDEPMQHRLAFRLGEVERQASLVAGFQHPREIVLAVRIARQIRQVAIGIAGSGRFDLDHFGAEIRQHGCGRGRCDEARAVQNLEAFEDAVFHGEVAPVIFVGLIPPDGIAVRRDRQVPTAFDRCWRGDATKFHVIAQGRESRDDRLSEAVQARKEEWIASSLALSQ